MGVHLRVALRKAGKITMRELQPHGPNSRPRRGAPVRAAWSAVTGGQGSPSTEILAGPTALRPWRFQNSFNVGEGQFGAIRRPQPQA